DLLMFVNQGKELLKNYRENFVMPVDLAYESDGKRREISVLQLPQEEMFTDLGHETVEIFKKIILSSGTIFVNGPAGVYESELSSYGTNEIWNAIGNSEGYSLIGGGDTVTAATKFVDLSKFSYICTAGGAMVRFLSGKRLPLIEAMLSGK
ncbi:MAG: phosphoglycerate kinase, partial [Clostridia bacterium]